MTAVKFDASSISATEKKLLSAKSEVIEILFDTLIGSDNWPTDRSMVVLRDALVTAIEERNSRNPEKKALSRGNPANFLKDFIRTWTCNRNWPERLSARRITARQVYGKEQIFEFIDFLDGDDCPFPDRFEPRPDISVVKFESISIPFEARQLGRQDEPWLIQVAVSQRLIETHLAIKAAEAGLHVESLAHLQVSVKTQPEIDATFVAMIRDHKGNMSRALVTVEAKQVGERILEHQIREQVAIAFETTSFLAGESAVLTVIPIVLKIVKDFDPSNPQRRSIYLAQFTPISRETYESIDRMPSEIPLSVQSCGLYEPHPPIAGISAKPKWVKSTPQKT